MNNFIKYSENICFWGNIRAILNILAGSFSPKFKITISFKFLFLRQIKFDSKHSFSRISYILYKFFFKNKNLNNLYKLLRNYKNIIKKIIL